MHHHLQPRPADSRFLLHLSPIRVSTALNEEEGVLELHIRTMQLYCCSCISTIILVAILIVKYLWLYLFVSPSGYYASL